MGERSAYEEAEALVAPFTGDALRGFAVEVLMRLTAAQAETARLHALIASESAAVGVAEGTPEERVRGMRERVVAAERRAEVFDTLLGIKYRKPEEVQEAIRVLKLIDARDLIVPLAAALGNQVSCVEESEPKPDPAVVNGVTFDRRLLRPLLPLLFGDTIEISIPRDLDPWFLRAPGVVAAVMPLRAECSSPSLAIVRAA